jgi:hypothetical protein
MRLRLRASQAEFVDDGYALILGLAGTNETGEHRLILQQINESVDPDEDWGVHLEWDDQSQSEYDAIMKCRLTGASLTIDLSKPLGALPETTGFDVELSAEGVAYVALVDGLKRVFRNHSSLLEVFP